ncbi:pyruvate kinase [Caldisericum exile]|uniref:Pyruvate kinase n=1 Tax=Caldisericum exile (strain DSM 21853 / NBRC 104410 / AZM16c01) TaxID=511051 RepID=A0A7U6GEB6_CALEA|nr:pyruvate kinase [Caldisericum exile]BAL80820.1 pyruvate kinase [Caldisericum exile AZM16c01]
MKQRIEKGKTKVVVTIGPSSESPEIVREFFNLGVDIFRLNFSHGTHEDHLRRIKIIREIESEFGYSASILQDLQGPKIRLGTFKSGEVILKEGDSFIITKKEVLGDERISTITYKEVIDEVNIGDFIYINDGLIKLKVTGKANDEIETQVIQGGPVSDHKGVNFPTTKLTIDPLTEKDIDDLRFGLQNGVDMVALSFVKTKEDVLKLKSYMGKFGRVVPIISKIEKWEAVENLQSIVEESQAVMVARGDLGVELPIEKIPLIQKEIIRITNNLGKPVITATQMLGSMVEEQFPTRAEVTDVANAIFDGSDALMLSNETAAGKNPTLSLKMMRSIIKEIEESVLFKDNLRKLNSQILEINVPEVLSKSIKDISELLDIKLIIVATESGKTATLVSKYKPQVPILALTPKDETLRFLNLKWGVFAYKVRNYSSVDEILNEAPTIATTLGLLSKGDRYIIVCGTHTGVSGTTNLIKVDVV